MNEARLAGAYGQAYNSPAMQVQGPSIQATINALEGELNQLDESFESLVSRIMPILNTGPEANSIEKEPVGTGGSDMMRSMTALVARVRGLRVQVNRVTSVVEL